MVHPLGDIYSVHLAHSYYTSNHPHNDSILWFQLNTINITIQITESQFANLCIISLSLINIYVKGNLYLCMFLYYHSRF